MAALVTSREVDEVLRRIRCSTTTFADSEPRCALFE
jgi:hypothetical protein